MQRFGSIANSLGIIKDCGFNELVQIEIITETFVL